MTKKTATMAAISGLIAAGALTTSLRTHAQGSTPAPGAVAEGECHGINSCKGKGDCGGKGHSCAGKNACKGKGWVKTTKEECAKQKGQFKEDKASKG